MQRLQLLNQQLVYLYRFLERLQIQHFIFTELKYKKQKRGGFHFCNTWNMFLPSLITLPEKVMFTHLYLLCIMILFQIDTSNEKWNGTSSRQDMPAVATVKKHMKKNPLKMSNILSQY